MPKLKVVQMEIAKLALKPGDTIILKYAGKLSYEIMERLKTHIELFFPGHRALVLDQGLELQVVTQEGG